MKPMVFRCKTGDMGVLKFTFVVIGHGVLFTTEWSQIKVSMVTWAVHRTRLMAWLFAHPAAPRVGTVISHVIQTETLVAFPIGSRELIAVE